MTGFDISTAQGIYLGGNQVQSLYLGNTKIWPTTPPTPHDYSQDYLTIEALSGGTIIYWCSSNSLFTTQILCSNNGGDFWDPVTSSADDGTLVAHLDEGEKLLIKGYNSSYTSSIRSRYNYFKSSRPFKVEGNIMSLIYGDNFIGQTTLTGDYTFHCLFKDTDIVNAENLILPATTLTRSCYEDMFSGCGSLTSAPALPATTLAVHCYYGMFSWTHITSAPALPATTLTEGCYTVMFSNCYFLTSAPALPATTLAYSCYMYMFNNCSSLTSAPVLPAATLAGQCYIYMFDGCSSLNYVKCLATDISAQNCVYNWLNGVSATGTFVKDASMQNWATGTNGIPSGWTVVDAN